MDSIVAQPAAGHDLANVVELARRAPGKVLAVVLGAHFTVWTLTPILVCPNLQLDLVEDLALGKEWQLGYWKHPPLPWWVADLAYRLTGQVDAVYVLGPLAAVLCFYAVWLLGREIVGPFRALIAVLVLEGVHFYNFSVVKFAHDQMQLPFWGFTALFFYRAIRRGRMFEWGLAGAFLAGAFWSKYAAFPLAATLGLILLFDPAARPAWRTAGPYLMALVFACVIAPNAWWLVESNFMPFTYVSGRAKEAMHWYDYVIYPLQWTGTQLFFLLPALGLLALLYVGHKGGGLSKGVSKGVSISGASAVSGDHRGGPFDRRYVTALALGPFAVTTLVFAVLGRLPVAMWGYPLWSFAPLAALAWLGPVEEPRRLRTFAAASIAVFVGFPVIYAGVELFEPLLRNRPKASQFPGAAVAATLTRDWHQRFGAPLAYVCGSEFAANNVAVYSPDRPHVLVHCDPELAPWIDLADLRRRGALVAWEEGLAGDRLVEEWRAMFGDFDVQPALVLARQTFNPVPARVFFAYVPPRP
jgi:4-amino-4-deoxy-L-arabinose transferase-like glycosyltransferase